MTDVTNPPTDGGAEVARVDSAEDDFTTFEESPDSHSPDEGDGDDGFADEDNPDKAAAAPEPDDADDEWQEIEWKGRKVKVPKEAALMQSDYTRKTQELASKRKEVEAAIERLKTSSREETDALARVAYVDAQLAQFESIDWDAWDQANPVEANRARWQYTELTRQREQAVNGYTQAQAQARSIAQQETARRVEEGQRRLQEKIPGWGRDKAVAILDFGQKAYDFSPDELQEVTDPRVIEVLHDAYQYRQLQAKQKQRAKAEQAQAVKPVPTLKGTAGHSRPRADTNDFRAFEKIAQKVLAKR